MHIVHAHVSYRYATLDMDRKGMLNQTDWKELQLGGIPPADQLNNDSS